MAVPHAFGSCPIKWSEVAGRTEYGWNPQVQVSTIQFDWDSSVKGDLDAHVQVNTVFNSIEIFLIQVQRSVMQ